MLKRFTLIALCAASLIAAPVRGADAPDTNHWESVASLGVTLTRGNSETFLGTVGVNSQRKWSKSEALLGASAGYGDNTVKDTDTGDKETTTTDKYAKGFGQFNYLFSDQVYGGLRLDAQYDGVAGVDYRVTLSPLVGYYLIKKPDTMLGFEAGPGFVAENLSDEKADQYITLRLAERFEHKFSDKGKVWQSAEFLPRFDDFGDYVLNAEVGASAAMTKTIELRVVLQDTYRSEPPEGRENNDLKIIAGVGYRF
jgi:putative salt-induced outer membrane protein YdiY